jgi:hypothetical protein
MSNPAKAQTMSNLAKDQTLAARPDGRPVRLATADPHAIPAPARNNY